MVELLLCSDLPIALFGISRIADPSPPPPVVAIRRRFKVGGNTRRIVFSALLIFAFPFPARRLKHQRMLWLESPLSLTATMVQKPVRWLHNFCWIILLSTLTFSSTPHFPRSSLERYQILSCIYTTSISKFQDSLPLNFGDSLHLDILKEALLRAIHDIDATFTKEASNRKLDSGSTATVALTADGQLLVASIGDSKALLCSEKFETPEEARATSIKLYRERKRNRDSSSSRFSDFKLEHRNGLIRFIAKELTKDHHPDREDEMLRVKAAGGYVTEWAGVPRVNGQLAVSRSIGDLTYKSYGVISAPEVMDWQPLLANDSYLVVSSDGIFEKLEVQDVCDRLWEVKNQTSFGAGVPSYCSVSLADCLVNTAFEKGSMDNMAAVVVPLQSNIDWQSQPKEQYVGGNIDEFASGLQMKNTYALPYRTFGALQLKQAQPVPTMFNELLVEVENKSFHMAENLNASYG